MTKVAFIGYGFMGRVHAACWQRIRGVRVAAVCVRNPAPLADIRASLALVDAERASARTGRHIALQAAKGKST